MSHRYKVGGLVICGAVVAGLATPASAITIVRNFLEPGVDSFLFSDDPGGMPAPPPPVASAAPGNLAGGGNLVDVFNAAADWWEAAVSDSHTYVINYGWSPLGGSTLGQARQYVTEPPPTAPFNESQIKFDSDGSSTLFADPTPHENSEYTVFTPSSADLGGGEINTGLEYSGATGDAAGNNDLLSIAKHEIGHLLGIADFSGVPMVDPDILKFTVPTLTTTAPRPLAGTVIPTTASGGGHIDIGTALLFPSITTGTRRGISQVDVLAVAEVNGFTGIVIPEPLSAMCLAMTGAALLMRRGDRVVA